MLQSPHATENEWDMIIVHMHTALYRTVALVGAISKLSSITREKEKIVSHVGSGKMGKTKKNRPKRGDPVFTSGSLGEQIENEDTLKVSQRVKERGRKDEDDTVRHSSVPYMRFHVKSSLDLTPGSFRWCIKQRAGLGDII